MLGVIKGHHLTLELGNSVSIDEWYFLKTKTQKMSLHRERMCAKYNS